MKSYSLAEVAADHLPAEWTDSERWLRRRLNRGEIQGVRFGRSWRMTERQVEAMLATYSNSPTPTPEPVAITDALSTQSRRRLRSAS